eukprot:CAMPEP_0167805890 /NCGR_PEP_ID=MMETSP0111_2-20121227/21468_1 /TAXON_ID=91324 /ORGANISM="Lotharella globosa, Strain CCCM811" /LENGTH=417 /DNA_ID=CAMNT_0007703171 /DNA_START=38 /DNA_END=1291 /DNA_ORIENTATION=+
MGIFVKSATLAGISAFQLVLMRALFQGVMVSGGICYYKIPTFFGEPSLRWWLVMRGIVGGIGFCCYFVTIQLLPLGDSIALCTLYPVFTVVIARVVLKEMFTTVKLVAVVVCMSGAFMIAQPSFLFPKDDSNAHANASPYAWVGYITAFTGSLAGAFVFVIIRRAKKAHTLQLVWSWVCGGVTISAILGNTVTKMVVPTAQEWLFIVPMCLIGTCAHLMLNYSGRLAPAGPSSLLRASDVLFAYLWEVFIFGEEVNAFTIVGAVLIMTGVGLVAYSKYQHSGQSATVDDTEADFDTIELHLAGSEANVALDGESTLDLDGPGLIQSAESSGRAIGKAYAKIARNDDDDDDGYGMHGGEGEGVGVRMERKQSLQAGEAEEVGGYAGVPLDRASGDAGSNADDGGADAEPPAMNDVVLD